VLSSAGVAPRHLNKHIDYSVCCAPAPNPENARSLAQRMDMAITQDGSTLYVAAFGSSKIGVFKTAQLDNDTFVPSVQSQIAVSGGGPSGLALDEDDRRLYVVTRFDNSISVIDTRSGSELRHIPMFNPEPASVTTGRRYLYDASFTSSHGDSACGSCHIFGDFDGLAWNLGNPDIDALPNPSHLEIFPIIAFTDTLFRPLKGPMVTQSLRGMDNHGPMHWRGDRTGVNDEPTAEPNGGQFNEQLAFSKFNPAFQNLLGRNSPLSPSDLQAFTDFILQVTYPPNPIRNLDNSLTTDQQAGRDHFFQPQGYFGIACNTCHVLDPKGNRQYGVARPGFFGTQGELVIETLDPVRPQPIKIPHLRNIYQKVGRFGQGLGLPPFDFVPGSDTNYGDQVRGFGVLHDGAFDTVFRFMQSIGFSTVFSAHGLLPGPDGDVLRRQVESFVMAFDSNMAPIVGQQITLTQSNWNVAGARIQLLMDRAAAGECDLVVKSNLGSTEVGMLYNNAGLFITIAGRRI
jgi:YVTN family beta-propeller protein